MKGARSNCFLIISRACCETASAGTLAQDSDSFQALTCRAQWARSVICHCKGRRKWLYLSERIQFHPTITSLLCLQIFSQRKKGWSYMWCRISAFYSYHFIFFSSKDISTKCFFYVLELQAMKLYLNCSFKYKIFMTKCDSCHSFPNDLAAYWMQSLF